MEGELVSFHIPSHCITTQSFEVDKAQTLSCVALGKLFNLSVQETFICKTRQMTMKVMPI